MPATMPYGVDLAVELGLGRAADQAAWGSGVWGVQEWAQTDTSLGDYVDVSCDTSALELAGQGADGDGVLTRWEAATATLTLHGAQYDPWQGPWSDRLGPMLPTRVRWRYTGDPGEPSPAFTGFVDEGGWAYDPIAKTATVACVDATTVLASWDGLEQAPVGQGETANQRVGRILDAAEWPTAARDITPGGVTVKSTTLAENAWTMLLQVADTDLALLWVDRSGRVAYRPWGRFTPAPPVAVLAACPQAGQVGLVTYTRGNPVVTRNIVSVSRQVNEGAADAATVTVRDDGSVARYRPHSYQRTDLIHTDDAWSTRVASAILHADAWPNMTPRSVDLDIRQDRDVAGLLLDAELGDEVTLIDEHGTGWACMVIGAAVTADRHSMTGTLNLDDMNRWRAAQWGTGRWHDDTWGW